MNSHLALTPRGAARLANLARAARSCLEDELAEQSPTFADLPAWIIAPTATTPLDLDRAHLPASVPTQAVVSHLLRIRLNFPPN